MSTNATPTTIGLSDGEAVLSIPRTSGASGTLSRAESLQRRGKAMILAGFIITIVGVVLYCGVCFAGGMDAEMGDVLFRNAVPFGGATLAVLGLGTLVWLAGSVTFLRGAMDIDEAAAESAAEPDESAARQG